MSYDQTIKSDEGKLQLSLVPPQIIKDIAEIRMYGNEKYHDPDSWKRVEMVRYIDALYRHFLEFIQDPFSKDEESGKYHYKHMACNMAFICDDMKDLLAEKEDIPRRPRGIQDNPIHFSEELLQAMECKGESPHKNNKPTPEELEDFFGDK